MKPPSPLLGFNNNVRHKGRVFHIQTEDSGVRHPHIITHLFADGGRILKTTKTSYAEFIDAANMGEVVRQMMQDQHKAMFMALRDGQFDHLVEEAPARGQTSGRPATQTAIPAVTSGAPPTITSGAPPTMTSSAQAASSGPRSVREAPLGPPPIPLVNPLAATQPMLAHTGQPRTTTPLVAPPIGAVAKPLDVATKVVVPVAPVVMPQPPAVATTLPAGAPLMPNAPVAPPPLPPLPTMTSFPSVPPADPVTALGHVTRPTPPRGASARPRLDIDPAAIHRAPEPHSPAMNSTLAAVVEASVDASPGIDLNTLERAAAEAETPLFQQIRDLPPPPTSVLATRPPAASPGGYSSVSAPAPPPSAAPQSSRSGRYAPSRPSSIFAAVRPAEGASIFGEDLISEKSLDEVILSYLAEDLDGPGEKK